MWVLSVEQTALSEFINSEESTKLIPPANVAHLAQRTVKRLDICFKRLDEGSEERAHALLYAAFLSDVVSGAIALGQREVVDMLVLVEDFCQLVESREASLH